MTLLILAGSLPRRIAICRRPSIASHAPIECAMTVTSSTRGSAATCQTVSSKASREKIVLSRSNR